MIENFKNAVTKSIYDCFGDEYSVYTAFTEQGFTEPCFIVEMFPMSVQAVNDYLDDETQTVRIRYVPKDISQDEFIKIAEKMRELFLYKPLVLADGMRMRCFNIQFSEESYTLITELTYSYTVKVRNDDEMYDKAEELRIKEEFYNGIT